MSFSDKHTWITIDDKDMFELIKLKLQSSTTSTCSNCGAICTDSKKLSMLLREVIDDSYGGRYPEAIGDAAGDILSELIEFEPEYDSMTVEEWIKWDALNESRKCDYLGEYDRTPYLKYSRIYLAPTNDCTCYRFARVKTDH